MVDFNDYKIVNICNIANIERAIKDVIDPGNKITAEGDGMASMCHNVLIQSALTQSIAVKATIEFDTGEAYENWREKTLSGN